MLEGNNTYRMKFWVKRMLKFKNNTFHEYFVCLAVFTDVVSMMSKQNEKLSFSIIS